MKAEVAFAPLLAAARALKPYTTPQTRHTPTQRLYLHASGDTLTLSATTGRETASVPLSGAICDGWCALAPDALIKALTTIKPSRKAANTATVTLRSEAGRLHLSVGDGPAVGLDTDAQAAAPPTVPAMPALREQPVTRGPVAPWCTLIAGVAAAASREPARPDLAVVRLLRDQPSVVLMVEAASGYRVHRGTWGEPDGNPVDVPIPAQAAQRAVRLLNAIDPAGHVRVHADEQQVLWRTDRVRLAANTGGRPFPNLEKLREDLLDDATAAFTVNRVALLAALDTARGLTTAVRHPRVRLEPSGTDVLNVVIHTDSGAPMYTVSVPITTGTGPAQPLILNPVFAQQGLVFLDGDRISVHAIADRLPIYLVGVRRHAILMQIAR